MEVELQVDITAPHLPGAIIYTDPVCRGGLVEQGGTGIELVISAVDPDTQWQVRAGKPGEAETHVPAIVQQGIVRVLRERAAAIDVEAERMIFESRRRVSALGMHPLWP